MAYVRKKGGRGQPYYQLVESRRVDGRPRQRVLIHLGRHPTVEEALKGWPKEAKRLRRDAEKARSLVPASAGRGADLFYRDTLRRAEGLEKAAAALEEKRGRLRVLAVELAGERQ